MIGIKKSIANLVDIPFMELGERQFRIKFKSENQWISNLDMKSNGNIKRFKFHDYAPLVF